MKNYPKYVKNKLFSIVRQMADSLDSFVYHPGKDFTRNRKLDFSSAIKLLLSMGGNSIKKELYNFFNYDENTLTSSAFCQQRSKIKIDAFEFLLNEFNTSCDKFKTYNGYRLLAIDGSDLNIYHNPEDTDTYICHSCNSKGYNSLHLNGLYDLLNKLYLDVVTQPGKHMNEYQALADMVDRSNISENVIVIGDRGYESYNVFAHIIQKGWEFVIRCKDINSNGIATALQLPSSDEFDTNITLTLTRRQTKEIKSHPEIYRFLPQGVPFDFIDENHSSYTFSFRVIRIMISENTYETIFTNLDKSVYPSEEIKKLYKLRWGIETSFRELKYAIGLASFHSKKVAFITQEIFARLVMYNFCEMITLNVVIKKKDRKYNYQTNFTAAIDICKAFFRCPENIRPPNVEALIQKNILPIRKDRKFTRFIRRGRTISFVYRVS